MAATTKIIFLSAVSQEFHNTDPARPQVFSSYRDALKKAFRLLGPEYAVIVQGEIAQGTGDLLETLDAEIARSTLVIHLVGNLAGERPSPASIRKLKERHPDLLKHEPELATALEQPPEPSYTQWELYLAYEHRKHRFVYLARASAPRSPFYKAPPGNELEESQKVHCMRWKAMDKHYEYFDDQFDLTIQAFASAVKLGLGPPGGAGASTRDALEKARAQAEVIAQEVRRLIKEPDRRAVPVPDAAGVADFLHAIDTAALRRELDRRGALQVLDELRDQKHRTTATEPTAENLLELALVELACGHYRDAMRVANQAAEEAMKQIGPPEIEGHRETAINAFILVHEAAIAAHHYDSAVVAQEKAGQLVNKARFPVQWADIHQSLAASLVKDAQYQRAADLIDEILEIREQHHGESDLALANTLLLRVRVLYEQGKFQGLESVAARAARLFASLQNLSGVATSLDWQARLLQIAGHHEEAETLLRRALTINEERFGKDHPNVGASLNNLNLLLRDTNRLAEAEPLIRRALTIVEESFGKDHPDIAVTLNNLAQLLQETNRLAEAEPLLRRALTIVEESFGKDHPHVAVTLNNLARLLQETDRLAEAEPLIRRALAISERCFGEHHPVVALSLTNLALLNQAINRLAEAEPLMRRALEIVETSFGSEHPNTVKVRERLNILLLKHPVNPSL